MDTFTLAFDPGQYNNSWAFCFSTLRLRGETVTFCPLEVGFVPVLEDPPRPDFSKHKLWIKNLFDLYPQALGSTTLVAERFVGRGLTGKMAEYISIGLGFWAGVWSLQNIGRTRLIMAAQWKKPLKKLNEKYPLEMKSTKFENWWEDYFAYFQNEPKTVHIQDACGMAFWFNKYELKTECSIDNLDF